MKNIAAKKYIKETLPSDFTAGIVVFLIAIPLCLGVALASGVPLMAGVIAGIVGGIVVGIFGGSELGVSGPAAGLVAVVLSTLAALGTFEVLLLATAIAGLMQIVLGMLRAGILAYYVPSAVITGLLSAIGIIIIFKQLPYVLGHDLAHEMGLTFKAAHWHISAADISEIFSWVQPASLIIALSGLAILIFWERPGLKKYAFFRVLPGPLAVIIIGVGLQISLPLISSSLTLTPGQLVRIPTEGGISGLFSLPDFSAIVRSDVGFMR